MIIKFGILFFALVALAISSSLSTTMATAKLDVQVYEGDDAVGIIVSIVGPDSGFDVALDDNSTVIVRGDNVSSSSDIGVVVGGPGVEVPADNSTTTVTEEDGNETSNETTTAVEIPHIGSAPITYYNDTAALENITSSTDMINVITGGNISSVDNSTIIDSGIVVGNETSTIENGSNDIQQDEVNEIVEKGLGCLSGDELRKLIYLLSLFSK